MTPSLRCSRPWAGCITRAMLHCNIDFRIAQSAQTAAPRARPWMFPKCSYMQLCLALCWVAGRGGHVQRVSTVAFGGIEARAVDVQVQVAPGMPAFNIV